MSTTSSRLMYTRKYANEASLDADHKHLKQALSDRADVSGSVYKEALMIMLHSDTEIDFEALGSTGWELNEDQD